MQTFTSQAVDCQYNPCAAGRAGLPAWIALCAIIIPRAQGRKRLRLQTFTSQAVDCQYNSCAAGGPVCRPGSHFVGSLYHVRREGSGCSCRHLLPKPWIASIIPAQQEGRSAGPDRTLCDHYTLLIPLRQASRLCKASSRHSTASSDMVQPKWMTGTLPRKSSIRSMVCR